MKRPIILFNVSFILGVLLNEFIETSLNLLLILSILFSIVIFLKSKIFLIAFTIFISGYFITSISYPQLQNKEYETVARVSGVEENQFNKKYIIELKWINGKRTYLKAILISDININVGNEIKIKANLEKIYNLKNYKVFNNERYLRSKKIFYQIKSNDIEILSNKTSIKHKIIDDISKFFDQNLNQKSSSLMKSMILSVKSEESLIEDFRSLGLAHILAISGLHINIIINALEKLGKNFRLSRKAYTVLLISILMIYGYIIDFPACLLRALFMYILSIISITTYRIRDKINDLFLSMFLLLIINPFYVYSIGFYLSYSAVFSIYYISPKLENLFPKLSKSLITPFALQIGLFPFTIYFFNSVNVISILSNILIIPIASLSLIFGFIFLVLRFRIIVYIIEGTVLLTEKIVLGIKLISDNLEISFSSFDTQEIILYFCILIVLLNLKMIKYKLRKVKKSLLIFPCIILIVKIFIPQTIVNFIDVGQGDAALIRSNGIVAMIDVGGNYLNLESSAEKLAEYLNKNGVSKIHYLFISHDDIDHSGNLEYLKEKIKIESIYANKLDKYKTTKVLATDKIKIGHSIIEVVLDGLNAKTSNDSSLVLKLNSFKTNILFTGDVEENEKFIKIDDRISFLKVSHHGSKFSTTENFLINNNIENAIISVGKNNNYGHPNEETLQRLEDRNIKVYRTDTLGNIEIKINPFGFYIRPYDKKTDIFDWIIGILLY